MWSENDALNVTRLMRTEQKMTTQTAQGVLYLFVLGGKVEILSGHHKNVHWVSMAH